MNCKVLILDAGSRALDSLGNWFTNHGYEPRLARSVAEALECMQTSEYDLALIDVAIPEVATGEMLGHLKGHSPEPAVIITTECQSVKSAVQALRYGAYHYIIKPIDPSELSHLVGKALEHRRTRSELARLRTKLEQVKPAPALVGRSPAMAKVLKWIELLGHAGTPVLITGENGVGKESVARAIHAAGPRRFMPMLTIHCGALTETGLKQRALELADAGTLFLDEIGDINQKPRTDLLRALWDKQTGAAVNHSITSDCRCIAASNKSVAALTDAGIIDADLYQQRRVFHIHLPPLRERREDVPLLAGHFLNKLCILADLPVPRISTEALDRLIAYDWPGNARQLENAVERALMVNRGPEIRPSDFVFQFQNGDREYSQTLRDVERLHIEGVLREVNHNLCRAADILAIDRTTLYDKLRRYGISRPPATRTRRRSSLEKNPAHSLPTHRVP